MKIVAVSQRIDNFPDRGEIRDSLDQRLLLFIQDCSGLPIPVPNFLDDSIFDWLQIINPDAVVLSGGNDIGQYPARDFVETAMLDYAMNKAIPLLGICRGMQMMAFWAGTSIRAVKGHVRTRHQITGEINSDVNSFHNYVLSECPIGFDVVARSDDGEIEAIRHKSLRWEGWMWHPEREQNFSQLDIDRWKSLLK